VKGNPWNDVNGTTYYRDVNQNIVFKHNNQHYDAAQQICCNEEEGFPSTREYASIYTYLMNDSSVLHAAKTVGNVIT
jgi:hypothetical protein